jgi:uncharacterized protein (TIGR02147 family)
MSLSQDSQISTRAWLQGEFASRKQKNARYSLRAFARLVEMDASTVSQIMAGRRAASTKVLSNLCDRLSAQPEMRRALFSSLTKTSHSESSPELDYQLLAADAFAVMADWQHYAILDMVFLENFQSSAAWIAHTLGISKTETQVCIDRLVRLGLMRWDGSELVKTKKFLTNYEGGDSSKAHRELQRQILQMAINALEIDDLSRKDITGMTMAINPEQLPEAKRRIKRFRRSLCAFLETGPRTQMYQLGVQLYPLSKETSL